MMQVYQRWCRRRVLYSYITALNSFRWNIILHESNRTAKILTAFFSTAHQKHSCFPSWCQNSRMRVMFQKNLSKGAHDQGAPSGDEQNRTENQNAAVAKGINANMRGVSADWHSLHESSAPRFYSIPLF